MGWKMQEKSWHNNNFPVIKLFHGYETLCFELSSNIQIRMQKKRKLFRKDPLQIKDWKVLKIEKEMILQSRLILCLKCFDKKKIT